MILFDDGYGLFDDAAGLFDDGGVVNATATTTGQEATSAVSTITAAGVQSPTASVTGIEAESSLGTVSAYAGARIQIDGVQAESSVSEVIALGTGSAIATLDGVTGNSSIALVSAIGQSTRKGRKSNAKFIPFTPRPVELSIAGRATIGAQTAISAVADIRARGTTSARANVGGVGAETVYRLPSAHGIINPSDEEIILLMAA
jgi:hypothetical protein